MWLPLAQIPGLKTATVEQVKVLLKAIRGNQFETLYVIAVTTGLRQGELLGLKWEDVDLERKTLKVRRTLLGEISLPT